MKNTVYRMLIGLLAGFSISLAVALPVQAEPDAPPVCVATDDTEPCSSESPAPPESSSSAPVVDDSESPAPEQSSSSSPSASTSVKPSHSGSASPSASPTGTVVTTAPGTGGGLPVTGPSIGLMASVAGTVVILGAALVITARRRRARFEA